MRDPLDVGLKFNGSEDFLTTEGRIRERYREWVSTHMMELRSRTHI